MKDKTLAKIAIITTLIGLALLSFLSGTLEMKETKIADLCQSKEEEVKIRGVVNKVTETNKTLIIEITQPSFLGAVYFKKDQEDSIKEGSFIEAEGYIEEYKGKKQLIIEKMKT